MNNLIYNFSLLSGWLSSFAVTNHLHNASFASPRDLVRLSGAKPYNSSLLLGLDNFGRVLQVQSTRKRKELGNMLVVAPTRGGKGLLATSQLLTWKHSVIVNDIKGELFNETAGYRSTFSNVFVIDPTGNTNKYDPLNGKYTEYDLQVEATNLLYKPNEGEGVIFTQRATVMLTQLLLAANILGENHFQYVMKMVRLGLFGAASKLYAINPDLAVQFLDVDFRHANFDDRFLLSAWGTLSARMRLLLTENTIRCFDGSDFTARDIMKSDRPVTVYLRWPERDLLALSPLVRLLWGSLIDELINTYDSCNGLNCNPVLLLVDEAGRTAIPSLADHATTVAGRGISIWMAIQSLSQLDAIYGKTRASILRDNMDTQIYYRPSNQETADYLQNCLGYKSGFATSQSTYKGDHINNGLSEREIPLMTAQAIKQVSDEEIIGFHRGLPPFRAKRMDWRKIPELRRRQGLTPPAITMPPGSDASRQPFQGSAYAPALTHPARGGFPILSRDREASVFSVEQKSYQ